MTQSTQERNKTLVLQAFDLIFNKRNYAAAEKYWSPYYIQHSAHIAPGREGLFDFIKSLPPTLKYEPGTIVADGDFVIVHGRFSGFSAPVNWVAAEFLRVQNGIRVEHWDGHSGRSDRRAVEKRASDVAWRLFCILHPKGSCSGVDFLTTPCAFSTSNVQPI